MGMEHYDHRQSVWAVAAERWLKQALEDVIDGKDAIAATDAALASLRIEVEAQPADTGLLAADDVLTVVNAYEAANPADSPDYDPENIWHDVIRELPTYDAKRTDGFTDCDRFALTDGTIIRWEADQVRPGWLVDEPDDIACGQADETGEDGA